jgi:hypothetical protein
LLRRRADRALVELAQSLVHLHHVTFLLRLAFENASLEGGDLHRDLVSLQFHQRIALRHWVSRIFEPAGNRGLDDGLS